MNKTLFMPLAVAVLAFASCTDNDYDLSNIDSSVQVPVKDFVVPLKSAEVKLDDALDISDASKIQKDYTNGQYYVSETGNITASNEIKVPSFSANGMQKSENGDVVLSWVGANQYFLGVDIKIGKKYVPDYFSLTGEIKSKTVSFSSTASNVSEFVVDVDKIGVDADLAIQVKVGGLSTFLTSMHIKGLKVNFAKGLDIEVTDGTYDPATGLLTINDIDLTTANLDASKNFVYTINMKLKAINVGEGLAATFDAAKRELKFAVDATILDGATVTAKKDDLVDEVTVSSIPSSTNYTIATSVMKIDAKTFSGKVKYTIDGITPKTVNLGDIPSILKETGTNIELSNPKIYLTVNNPIKAKGLDVYAQTGIEIKGNTTIKTAADAIKLTEDDNKICLAVKNEGIKAGYKFVQFDDLKNVLSGGAVPSTLTISVVDPIVPVQDVTDFPLGETYGSVAGDYEFTTPLQLTENSKIHYEKDFASSENLDKLTISSATIDADVDSDVPLDLDVTVTVNGTGTMTGKTTLAAGQKTLHVDLKGAGVNNVTGVNVVADVKGNGGTLSPKQNIILKNIKLKVNGYYQEKL